jgi:hypothetical protein
VRWLQQQLWLTIRACTWRESQPVDETFYKSLVECGRINTTFMSRGFSLSNSIPKKIETECVQKSMHAHVRQEPRTIQIQVQDTLSLLIRTSIAALYPRLSRATRIAALSTCTRTHCTPLNAQISGAGLSPTEHNAFKSLQSQGDGWLASGQGCDEVSFDIKVKRQYRQPEKKGFHIAEFDNDKLQKWMTEYKPTFPTIGSCTAAEVPLHGWVFLPVASKPQWQSLPRTLHESSGTKSLYYR